MKLLLTTVLLIVTFAVANSQIKVYKKPSLNSPLIADMSEGLIKNNLGKAIESKNKEFFVEYKNDKGVIGYVPTKLLSQALLDKYAQVYLRVVILPTKQKWDAIELAKLYNRIRHKFQF